jgi:IclR family transcriptional regulator, KDG regulon repressor
MAWLSPEALEQVIARQSFLRHTDQTLDTPEKLVAELKAIRARGHAFDREEHEQGIICCAVPILSRSGRVLGALSVTSTTARTTLEALEGQAGLIKDIAAKIAAEAESWRFPEQN